ncbi:Uncharacterised protein [Mycobacterium tuberculosis]|nr:Uncharacterised protein [Mycobacterium tuberculosis]
MVGTKCVGLVMARRKALRTNMSCSPSSRFHASDGALAAAAAVNPSDRWRWTNGLLATGR